MLKEIKTKTTGNKCTKCHREIKQGWTAFYEPDGKKLYCQPCGKQMQSQGQTSMTSNPDIFNNIGTVMELIGMVNLKLDNIAKEIADIKSQTKKTTKK